jgi:hypothetical protein
VITFFTENLNKPVHRTVALALLHDQKDPLKRLRGNGGAKDALWSDRFVLLSGTYYRDLAAALGVANLTRDQFVGIKVAPSQEALVEASGYLDDQREPADEDDVASQP